MRARANAVILPDRSVLVVGGRANASGTPEQGVLYPELLEGQGAARRWRWMAPANSTRAYHSTALLLPDGRVLTGGGDRRRWDYQVFVPPYLLGGDPRPVVSSAPAVLAYSGANPGAYTLDVTLLSGESVSRVALLAPGSVTHSLDTSQRYVELALGTVTSTSVSFQAPLSASHAPPGFYMLFVVSAAGVPSVATWVQLG